jgi:hypothetical protein
MSKTKTIRPSELKCCFQPSARLPPLGFRARRARRSAAPAPPSFSERAQGNFPEKEPARAADPGDVARTAPFGTESLLGRPPRLTWDEAGDEDLWPPHARCGCGLLFGWGRFGGFVFGLAPFLIFTLIPTSFPRAGGPMVELSAFVRLEVTMRRPAGRTMTPSGGPQAPSSRSLTTTR